MSRDFDCELAIVGAGVVGCALARVLARRGLEVTVLEAGAREGGGVSSRNSGVVHAGLYYPPNSRKARTCVVGNASLWAWVEARGVGHRRCGKLVVARDDPAELAALDRLRANAEAAGARLEAIELERARSLEPELPASVRAACWSPSSGIVDAHGLTSSLRAAAEAAGATFVCAARVTACEALAPGFELRTIRGSILAERLINAAGLQATSLAGALGLERRLHLARGDYFRLRRHRPWRRLIYPVKVPASPALGIHLTLELDGRCRVGPDLDWLGHVDGDARGLAWQPDYDPARGEAKHGRFLAATRRLLGPVAGSDLVYDGCGIRPKLAGPDEPFADFELVEQPAGALHLLGIESPGLTAALALADEAAEAFA